MIRPENIQLETPNSDLGPKVHSLIAECPPLDQNSIYCNLLQAHHFSSTSVAAIHQSKLVGFVSGYLIPNRAETLFIWQVAAHPEARGIGLASNMLKHILLRPENQHITSLETTITAGNHASWKLFERLASNLNTRLEKTVLFEQTRHLKDQQDTEHLVCIGPFKKHDLTQLNLQI